MIYSIGIVGTGKMGKNHIRVLKNMSNKFNVVGLYDKNIESAKKIARQYSIDCFNTIDEMLKKVDSVIIAAPSSLHKDISLKFINSGINTFIEKPLALTIEDGEEIFQCSKNKNIICMVGHIERYNPVTCELIKILESEEILSIDIHRLSPFDRRIFDTDVALDLMVHDIDLLDEFVKEPITDIKSAGINVYSDTFDYIQSLIRYKSGKIASLTASRITEDKKRTVEISSKNAYIVADYLNRTIIITRKTKFSLDVGYSTKYKQENIQEKVFVPMIEPLLAELEHFHECIYYGSTPKTNIESSLNVLKICNKITEGAKEAL